MESSERLAYFKNDLIKSLQDFENSLELMPESEDLSQHADLLRNGIVQKFELVS